MKSGMNFGYELRVVKSGMNNRADFVAGSGGDLSGCRLAALDGAGSIRDAAGTAGVSDGAGTVSVSDESDATGVNDAADDLLDNEGEGLL